ncbi:hypothetical protein Tco_0820705 [Tanacetum coccineum]|uniref:Reverse transcriptase domain-containing protein n=1 Tax=Tanacetum coccineum TaxID=301880 RepID=A0ABQ5AEE5_9ASTR
MKELAILKLKNDLQILKVISNPKLAEQEEQAAKSFTSYENFSMIDDVKVLQDRENLMKDIQTFLRKFSLYIWRNTQSVENLVPILSEFKGISKDICDVSSCDYFNAEFGLINSLLSREISITSPKIDFFPEEFASELDLIDLILPRIDDDNFDEEEGEIEIDIFQIEDEILREKLLNVNLLIDKIEALNLTPSIPFVLEYPSSSPIAVVDSDFLIEEVDTFLVPEDSIPPGIESDFDSEGDIIFSNDLHTLITIPRMSVLPSDI